MREISIRNPCLISGLASGVILPQNGYWGPKMKKILAFVLLLTGTVLYSVQAQNRGGSPRIDMSTLVNPLEPVDTVWIEDMTQLEIRDAKFSPPIRNCVPKAFIFTYKRSF